MEPQSLDLGLREPRIVGNQRSNPYESNVKKFVETYPNQLSFEDGSLLEDCVDCFINKVNGGESNANQAKPDSLIDDNKKSLKPWNESRG
jgi:hypothetical protein